MPGIHPANPFAGSKAAAFTSVTCAQGQHPQRDRDLLFGDDAPAFQPVPDRATCPKGPVAEQSAGDADRDCFLVLGKPEVRQQVGDDVVVIAGVEGDFASAAGLGNGTNPKTGTDSTIHTDGWEGYVGLEALGYRHEYDFVATSSQSASELLPRVHRVAALLKRWLMGTHQGAVSREHLDYYLDEYTFRFNRRRSRHRGKLFYRLVQQAAAVGPTTYSEMVQHVRGRRISQPQDMG